MAKKYLVTWDILIDAKSPIDAAIDAARAIRSKDSPPLGFTVQEVDSHGAPSLAAPREVNLADYYWCPKCKEPVSDTGTYEDDPEEVIQSGDGSELFCSKCDTKVGDLTEAV